jgi:superfamily II DNA helicase RecQ
MWFYRSLTHIKVARFAQEIKAERVVCLTATATTKVALDICNAFNIPSSGLFKTTMYRPKYVVLRSSMD